MYISPYRMAQMRRSAQILKLAEQKRNGEITQEEYERKKNLVNANVNPYMEHKLIK